MSPATRGAVPGSAESDRAAACASPNAATARSHAASGIAASPSSPSTDSAPTTHGVRAARLARDRRDPRARTDCRSFGPKRKIHLPALPTTRGEAVLAVERLGRGILGFDDDREDAE